MGIGERGADIGDLNSDSLSGSADLIPFRGYMREAVPSELRTIGLAREACLEHVESHPVRVHGSLTSIVAAFRRG